MLAKTKRFSWSYSKIKNFETCPRRYQAVDVERTVEQERSDALDRGDDLHEAMKLRVRDEKKLPPEFIYMESWAEKLTRVLHPYQIIQVELKLSVDKAGVPTGYMDKTTWLRTKIDYLRTMPSSVKGVDIGHIVDYKTGKPPKYWDNTQLMLNAHTVFAAYKQVNALRVDYLWTEYNDTTHETFTRAQIPQAMEQILPRVGALETAHATYVFPPNPCWLCENYWPVENCEHHGK